MNMLSKVESFPFSHRCCESVIEPSVICGTIRVDNYKLGVDDYLSGGACQTAIEFDHLSSLPL
jgi:hypothetical protein